MDLNHPANGGRRALTPVTPEEASLLWEPAEHKVDQPALRHGITDLAPIGLGRIASQPQVVTRADIDWLILPEDLDPLYQEGKLAAPKEARARVDVLLRAGVQFDYLAIAHEVPTGSFARIRTSAQLQELLSPPTPRSLSVLATITGCIIEAAWSVGTFMSRRKVFVEPMPLLAPQYDPALFGAVVTNPPARVGAAALFYLIARWKY
jgi:hypothetical protein